MIDPRTGMRFGRQEDEAGKLAGEYESGGGGTASADSAGASAAYLTGLSASRVEAMEPGGSSGDDGVDTQSPSELARRAREMIARHEAKRREMASLSTSSGSD